MKASIFPAPRIFVISFLTMLKKIIAGLKRKSCLTISLLSTEDFQFGHHNNTVFKNNNKYHTCTQINQAKKVILHKISHLDSSNILLKFPVFILSKDIGLVHTSEHVIGRQVICHQYMALYNTSLENMCQNRCITNHCFRIRLTVFLT